MPPKPKTKKTGVRASAPPDQATMVITLYDGTRQPIQGKHFLPKKVYVLRWIAGRHAGVPEFAPPIHNCRLERPTLKGV